MKVNVLGDKLFGTVSLYDIRVSDRVVPETGNPNNSLQGGKVRSRGIEADINASPAPGFNIIAGYAFNESEVLEGNKTDFYSEPGRAYGGQGPKHLANLWLSYKFNEGKLKDFGAGFGGNYAGEYLVIDNSATGQFFLPEYTLLNGGLFYNGSKVRVNFNLNNITNKRYYTGYWSVNPQKTRNFTVSLGYKF
ncbi:TonB-dependent receptor [Chitinophaga horti]|uniref:TonB-dependent receptor n=1 Tax=Chitinophaga horti TaxID=2920382 RepID=A0ABY6J7D3_9BACT|nr:TonB-dependent receptor [Chitinophaga horti]UYQ95395.1 TonB-dependent receptor [Chitinophaga horti]